METPIRKHEWLRRVLLGLAAELGAGAPLPTERELAERYDVSRTTVRQALAALERAGTVHRVQGAGTFVSPATVSKTLSLSSFSEDMTERGLRPGSRVLAADLVPAGPAIAADLGLKDCGDLVLRLVRVRLADEQPMCLETTCVPASLAPGLIDRDLSGSLYAFMDDHGIHPVRAEQIVAAAVPDEQQGALLGIPPGAPALRVRRLAYDQRDRAVERSVSLYRADRYDIRFDVRREAP